MPDILHKVTLGAPPRDVYRALTTAEGLAAWWTTRVEAEPEEGSTASFWFPGFGVVRMRVEELVPPRRVRWSCLEGDPQWVGTELTFDLEESEGGSDLRFSHRGWEEATDFYRVCNTQWGFFLAVSLKELLETGRGRPVPHGDDEE